ncbi:MAG: thioredoxin family protein [Candidatus Dormibacteria bacterium]
MEIILQYFDGCPNWHVARERLSEALGIVGLATLPVRLQRVETPEEAERVAFQGSPTILINGRDAFAHPPRPGRLACRLYPGPGGAPAVDEFIKVLSEAGSTRDLDQGGEGEHGVG